MFSFNFYDEPGQEKTEQVEQDGGSILSIRIEDIVQQLPDTLAFSIIAGIPRRELWHIKMQLMQNDGDEHLLGDSDIIKGSYEGGLKTWECSIDLVNYLSQQSFPSQLSVLELGCGSGLPTALVFAHALKTTRAAQFVLQDYNDIFALSTVPNLFLTWYVTKHGTQEDLNEIEVTQDLKQNFVTDLKTLDIDFQFLVGSWGTSLINHLSTKFDLILSSEGIYSPKSLPQFTSVLLTCLGGKALVASKKVYFGVGGGVTEFMNELAKHNRSTQVVWEGGQVARVILQVS